MPLIENGAEARLAGVGRNKNPFLNPSWFHRIFQKAIYKIKAEGWFTAWDFADRKMQALTNIQKEFAELQKRICACEVNHNRFQFLLDEFLGEHNGVLELRVPVGVVDQRVDATTQFLREVDTYFKRHCETNCSATARSERKVAVTH